MKTFFMLLFFIIIFFINNLLPQQYPSDATPYIIDEATQGTNTNPIIFQKINPVPVNSIDLRVHPTTNTTQSEMSIAVHPLNNQIILASANASNYPVTTTYGTGYYISTDGGITWAGNDQPPSGAGNKGDPATVIDRNGYMYIGSISSTSGQGIMRSTNNGTTWNYYTVANTSSQILDKNHLAVDNTQSIYSGYLYSAWSDFNLSDRGITIARSTNSGQNWVSHQVISSGFASGYAHQGVNLQVGPNGVVYACWAVRSASSPFGEIGIGFNKSTNGGQTWGTPAYAINNIKGMRLNPYPVLGIRTNSFPVMGVNMQTGRIYIAWVNIGVPGTNTGDPDAYLIYSDNGGTSWSTPKRVNNDQLNNNAIQFHCWMSVDPITGDVYVAFYDNRSNIGTNICEFYVSKSSDNGQSFENFPVSDNSFSVGPLPGFGGNYNGEYPGIAANNGNVYPLWHSQVPSANAQGWASPINNPAISVIVDQKLSTNASVDSIGLWNLTLNKFDKYNVPKTFAWNVNDTKTLQGSQKIISNQKYNTWLNEQDVINHHPFIIEPSTSQLTSQFNPTNSGITIKNSLEGTTVDGGQIRIKDPWLIDYLDPQYGNTPRNQGMSAQFREQTSPFSPDLSSSYNGYVYKGLFLDQGGTGFTPPYYSVKVDAVQDVNFLTTGYPYGSGRTHKFYFQNWSGTNANFQNANNFETPVVFTLDGATAQANQKGTQLTNTQFQYGVGQRGFVRSTNGYLHNVYESMGDIFYERSTDNGTTWQLMNNGKPINPDYASASAKSPSVCFDTSYDLLYVVYQGSTFPYDGIVLVQFNTSQLANTANWVQSTTVTNFSYSNNYKPVIAAMGGSGVVVYDPPSTVTAGLKAFKFTIGSYPNYSLISTTEFTIPGADQNSSNPSIAAGCQYYYFDYQQAETSIRYLSWAGGTNPTTYTTVSSGSSYLFNVRPTISLTHCTNPVVSWIGGTYDYYHSGFYYGSCVMTRVGPTWGSINIISTSNAQVVNNNSTTEYGYEYISVIAYSFGSGPFTTKWVKRTGTSYTTPATLSYNGFPINGIFPQVSSGASTNDMKALVYNSNSLPYYYIQSTTSFGTVSAEVSSISGDNISLSKISENDTIVTFGRSGVASINDIEFVFEIGDIVVGDSVIKFIEVQDTLTYNSTNEINQHTRTNNFTLTPTSNFYFSNIYYVVQKSSPDTALTTTDAVNFKAELVNAITDQVVGTFDNITYNKNNLEKYASIDYEVDCSGITAGEYYLRLVTSVNTDAAYALANIVSDNTTLAKKNFNKVNFMGSEIPITYELSNNFPNPFNPSTTIRYQIPQDGIVTLKIYDILGSEVATLVNEEKVAGKYEVNFNASSLASGVYIYKIQAGSFVNSKKMILLK